MLQRVILVLGLLTQPLVAKKSPRQGSTSRASSAYAASKRKPKLSYDDWDNVDGDVLDDEAYFRDDEYRPAKSTRGRNEFVQKKARRSAEDQATARSEGTFSGAGKGPLYDAYNQLHTLAQVCIGVLLGSA
jgi:hypothetical protein